MDKRTNTSDIFLMKRLMQVKMNFTNRFILFSVSFSKMAAESFKRQDHQAERRRICVTWPPGSWGRRHFGEVDKVPRCFCFGKNKCLGDVLRYVFHNICFVLCSCLFLLLGQFNLGTTDSEQKIREGFQAPAAIRKRPSLFCRQLVTT